MLKQGDNAPTFVLLDQYGDQVSLSDFLNQKVFIYFYPKADTPGCTTQSCLLRDIRNNVGDTKIIGISPDTPAKQLKFDKKYELNFTLLADAENAVANAYDVWQEKSMYGKKYMGIVRSAFLIDVNGRVEQVWYKISPQDTPLRLLESIAK